MLMICLLNGAHFLVFKCSWIIVMKCIFTIKRGEICGNNQQMCIELHCSWAICNRLANQIIQQNSPGKFTNQKTGIGITKTVERYSNNLMFSRLFLCMKSAISIK